MYVALDWVAEHLVRPATRGFFAAGHSSGAHIVATALLQRVVEDRGAAAQRGGACAFALDGWCALSGVFDIARHFEWEAARGVHELSPMQPACGGRKCFAEHSPALVAQKLPPLLAAAMPPTLLLHGTADGTVPYTASVQMFEALRSWGAADTHLRLLDGVGHADLMVEWMLGGDPGHALGQICAFCTHRFRIGGSGGELQARL